MSMLGARPRFNFAVSVRDWLHDLRLVRNCLEAQIERLDRMEVEMDALLRRCGVGASTLAPGAQPVALNLDIQPQPDGSARFVIDGGASFSLAPRLSEVFLFLASGDKDRSAKDGLVGWRSRREIILLLEKNTGKAFTTRYLNGIVYLLKKALREAGYDARLIQTHRQKGIRFAYKGGAQSPVHSGSNAHLSPVDSSGSSGGKSIAPRAPTAQTSDPVTPATHRPGRPAE